MTTPTPKDLAQAAAKVTKGRSTYDEQLYQRGRLEGRDQARKQVLGWLESHYTDSSNSPERGSAEGRALLRLAMELSKFMKTGD